MILLNNLFNVNVDNVQLIDQYKKKSIDDQLEVQLEEANQILTAVNHPGAYSIISDMMFAIFVLMLCTITGTVICIIFFTFNYVLHEAWYLLLGILILFFSEASLYVYKRMHQTDQETQKKQKSDAFDAYENYIYDIKRSLSIPNKAAKFDVFASFAVDPEHKNEFSMEVRAYIKKDSLYLSNLHDLWEIPLSKIKSIREINDTLCFTDWHKKDDADDSQFVKYDIFRYDDLTYSINTYYQVTIKEADMSYIIVVGNYDIEAIVSLLEIKISK